MCYHIFHHTVQRRSCHAPALVCRYDAEHNLPPPVSQVCRFRSTAISTCFPAIFLSKATHANKSLKPRAYRLRNPLFQRSEFLNATYMQQDLLVSVVAKHANGEKLGKIPILTLKQLSANGSLLSRFDPQPGASEPRAPPSQERLRSRRARGAASAPSTCCFYGDVNGDRGISGSN